MPKSKRNKQGQVYVHLLSIFIFILQQLLLRVIKIGIEDDVFVVDLKNKKIAVTLSKTKKKGRDHKEVIVNGIKEAAEKYGWVYVFSFENMRNQKFKEFREQLKSNSRFFLGSNKVMQVALGRSAADEIRPGLHKVSKVVSHSFLLINIFCFIFIIFLIVLFYFVFIAIASRCWDGFHQFA